MRSKPPGTLPSPVANGSVFQPPPRRGPCCRVKRSGDRFPVTAGKRERGSALQSACKRSVGGLRAPLLLYRENTGRRVLGLCSGRQPPPRARVSRCFVCGDAAADPSGIIDCDGSRRNACADRWPDNPARTASDFVQKSLAIRNERVIALESRSNPPSTLPSHRRRRLCVSKLSTRH